MMNEEQINESVMKTIRFRILQIEKKNAKSHEKKDADMVSEIVKIIQSEVDPWNRGVRDQIAKVAEENRENEIAEFSSIY